MRNFFMNLFLTLAFCIISVSSLHAVKAYPYPIVVRQPDGSEVTIKIYGNEFRHLKTTIDDYPVKQNAKGFWIYAILDNTGKLKETEYIARDIEKRSTREKQFLSSLRSEKSGFQRIKSINPIVKKTKQPILRKAYPLTNSPKSLVILVNFKDKSFVTPEAQIAFHDMLNQSDYNANGATGSARDYFMSSSYGNFSPMFDVVGPFDLNKDMSYYGANDESGYDINPAELIVDACFAAHNAGIDFTQYDTDNDGLIDNVFVYYAGYNEAEGADENTIWPHRWVVYTKEEDPVYYTYDGTIASVTFDGKRLYDYACSSELKGNSDTNMAGIGTFCHEFGHVLGLPDYYHTEEYKETLNGWDIMDDGSYNNNSRTPPTYSTYSRFYLGWLIPQEINTPSNLTLLPIYQEKTKPVNTLQQSYLLSATTHNLNGNDPSPREFFMLEYRKKIGWDTYLPAEGMLIWHIDFDPIAWEENTVNNYMGTIQTSDSHMRVYLQPLNGSTTTPGTAFTNGSFIPTTWTGININREISHITKSDDKITFKLMGGMPDPVIQVGIIYQHLKFPRIQVNTNNTKILNIKTTDITEDLTLSITGEQANCFSIPILSISKEAANSAEGVNITITYQPISTGTHTATFTISGGGLNPSKIITLTGEAY
jgi:immune inhibitor A